MARLMRMPEVAAGGTSAVLHEWSVAEGADFAAVMTWIGAHDGEAEATAPAGPAHGLYGSRLSDSANAATREPLRFVLPAGALS